MYNCGDRPGSLFEFVSMIIYSLTTICQRICLFTHKKRTGRCDKPAAWVLENKLRGHMMPQGFLNPSILKGWLFKMERFLFIETIGKKRLFS